MSDQDIIDTIADRLAPLVGVRAEGCAKAVLAVLRSAGYEVVRRASDGYCTCYPDQRYKTADCGVAAHRAAAEKAEEK